MFSKYSKAISLLICPLFLLTACDQFLKGRSKDEEKKSNIVEISTEEISCLKEAPKDLQKFFDDEGDNKVIEKSIGCVQSSLKTFMRLTRGSQPDAYLAKEVQYFFNTFLLKENKISDEFQNEIMKFKVVVVGGSADVVTRLELEQFIEFLGKMQGQLLKLQGKMRLAFFRGDRKTVQPKDLADLKNELTAVSHFVLKNTKLTASRYQWLDFIAFLTQLNQFTGESKGLTQLLEWEPLASSAKLLFLGDNAKLVSESDWYSAETWVLNTYGTMLRFYYQIMDREFETPAEWATLLSWLDDMILAVDQAPVMKEKKIFEVQAIDGLIDEVLKLNLFKTVLTADLIKSTYKKALVHFVEAQSGRGEALKVGGLTNSHLRILKQEYSIWKLSQKFLIDTYSEHPRLELRNLRYYAPRYDIRGKVEVSSLEQEELETSWKDFQNLLEAQPGVTYSKDLKVQIQYLNEIEPLTFKGANMINAVRSYTRLALRGYGNKNEKTNFKKKMTREGMIHLEEDFREFGRALAFLDPREKNSASRTFDQGNFFSFHGNGDEYLDATEAYEILSLLISGGRTQINMIFDDLQRRNCMLPEKDIFNKNYIQEDCFYRAFKENYKSYIDSLPGMVKFLSSLNDQQFAQTYQALMSIAYLKEKEQQGRVEFTEIRSLQCILNFIESLMVTYDRNHNMLLSEAEVVKAAPRFKSFVAKASPLGNFLSEDIFLYLVFTGKKPTVQDSLDVMAFLAKRNMSPAGLGETGRFNLIQLLSVLHNESK